MHLVGEFDATTSTMSFFLNGALVGTAADPTPLAGGGPLSIGRGQRSGAAADQFRGAVTGVQVYNRLLTQAEVTSLYSGGRAGAPVAAVNTVKRRYGKRGLPLTGTDQLGAVTGYSYDEAGQLAVTAGGASAQVRPVTTTGYTRPWNRSSACPRRTSSTAGVGAPAPSYASRPSPGSRRPTTVADGKTPFGRLTPIQFETLTQTAHAA